MSRFSCCVKMSEEKRKRSPNWLPSEKILLLDLVENHFGVVENKKTDGSTIKAKLAEWKIISIEYNSQTTHCQREAENLKNQWESMKKAAKKTASHSIMRIIQTEKLCISDKKERHFGMKSGGSPIQKKEDPIHERIISLITTRAKGLFHPFDSDSIAPIHADSDGSGTGSESEYLPGSCNKDLKIIIDIDQPLPVKDMMDGATSANIEFKDCGAHTLVSTPEFDVKDWGDYTPQFPKTPLSTQLKTANKKPGMSRRRTFHTPVTSSIELLHKQKVEAINFQKILATEEAEGKRTCAQLDIEIKKEIFKQEKIKTKLLLLELRKKKKEYYDNNN